MPWGSCTDALGLMHPDRKTCIAFLKVYATLKAAVGGGLGVVGQVSLTS
jgi:hypothetical protein